MKKNNKEVTIYDIARELEVSPATVSRALQDHHSIGKKTTKAVKKLAQKLGYHPNTVASSLRRNRTNTIGVIVPMIHRPFIASLISGIEETVSKKGYNVIISQTYDVYEKEVINARTLYSSRVAGLIFSLSMETSNYEHFHSFLHKNIPLVSIDRIAEEIDTDRVIIDNYAAGFKATEHLISMGCTRIAHFGGAQHRNIYDGRQRGYIDALKSHNLPIDEDLIVHNKLSMEEGQKSTEHLLGLAEPPDGIFSANDSAAVGAIQYAKAKGIRIPQELSIVGFNDDPISSIIEPSLTTISHPAFDMGKIAAQQVLKNREHTDIVQSQTIVLKTELIQRASSLKNGAAVKK
ncbi:DNA-binding LacI/PurR family transcriptional regulator [Catalinimonas alkaloidigena]|uniref:LacI family DNA-binding transcriptional regulator n=1 Tax=Catalinimonas alkaloidigena TaxID=1075417 RepID=UPI002406DF3F|nr:LacI family DNA-binding transcriptional regulator [Catalinimonas alkaloidigena]MDF9799499.1 DNA-binding LacI/PurR family transcriptional regulator [Catalinimonas alkaloidigena]